MTAAAARTLRSRRCAAVRLSLSEENLFFFLFVFSSLPSLSSELKAHLASCASCAAEAAALDPTLVFAPLAASVSPEPASTGRRPAPPVAEDARRVADAVLEEVRRRARVTTSVAAAPAAVLVAHAPRRAGGRARRPRPRVSRGSSAGRARASRRRPSAIAAAAATPGAAAPAPPDAPARPLIEGMRSPNARVYEFASASPQEPAVVFVANPNADL